MKKTLFMIVLLFSFVELYSQKIAVTMQREYSVPAIGNIPIIETDTFYCCQLNSKESAQWSVFIEKVTDITDSFGNVIRNKTENKICISSRKMESQFALSTTNFDKNWFKGAKTYDVGSARYFKGYIVCKVNGQADTLSVYINALPSKPLLSEITYNYQYFDYEIKDIYESYYDGMIYSENSDKIFTVQTDMFWIGGNNFECDYGPIFISPCNVDSVGKNLYHFTEEMGSSWDVGICFEAYNKYGYSQMSDTIFAKNYMPADIVKILEDAYYTGIDSPTQDDAQFNISAHVLHSESAWKQLQLFDMSGKCCYSSTDYQPSTMLPASLNGFYIIRVLYSDNKKIIKKVKL